MKKGDGFMVSLKEACQKVLARHPKEYIHLVNEYKDVYEFSLRNKGEKAEGMTVEYDVPVVDKKNGKLIDPVSVLDKRLQGDYKQYTVSDLERL
jgi:hypothetical protein